MSTVQHSLRRVPGAEANVTVEPAKVIAERRPGTLVLSREGLRSLAAISERADDRPDGCFAVDSGTGLKEHEYEYS